MNSKDQYEVTPLSTYDEREFDMQIRMLPMRDGKKLYTAVFLPKGVSKPVGTILFRSPYFRRESLAGPSTFALRHGLAAVYQHCRGTAASEGEFFPTRRQFEEHDGEDTLNWILQQPWSNGRVALIGSSYSGLTQWAAAYSGSSAIVALRPHVAAVHSCNSIAITGGGSKHGFMVCWGLSMFHRNKFGYNDVPDFDADLFHLPVNETDLHYNYGVVEFFRDFIRSAQTPSTMRQGLRERFSNVKAPAFISGGWYDAFKQENILSFNLMKEIAASDKARRYTRMFFGPWVHGGLINKEEFGEENDQKELVKLQDQFILNALNDPDSDPLPGFPQVTFFLLGEKRWCHSETWPPQNKEKKYFLRKERSLAGTPEEEKESISSYTYDPADPTPSFNGKRHSLGYYDRRETEKRSDIICFTSENLDTPLTIAGNVKLRLFARSSAPDTDFYATLSDVYPDGRSMFLVTGMVRARFSKSLEREEFLSPGEIREYEINLGDIANTFLPGHALRLAIHSANFPSHSRNLNTKAPVNEGVFMESAFQEIFHDAEHHSCLILPESTEKF
ncbi:MAG: CocE/NonD family hydrolase [Lentisphaeria bacterium]|nr:CocE/NonD family hydrolase [Lentisphaeria bacterium]